MRCILFVILLLHFSFAKAQKIHFTDTSNKWVVYNSNTGKDDTVHYVGDTLMGGIKYLKFHPAPTGIYNIPLGYGDTIFIREDTLAQKVYAFCDTCLPNDRLLYDFKLNVGDIEDINYPSPGHAYGGQFKVADIDSIIINSVWHKVWRLLTNSVYHYINYHVIEGIGSTNGPFYQFTETGHYLSCFSNAGMIPSLSSKVKYYDSGIYFDNSCTVKLNISLSGKNTFDILVYPNPVDNIIKLHLYYDLSQNEEYLITDITGHILLQEKITTPTQQIDIHNLAPGIYFIQVISNGQRFIQKFVKQ